MANGNGNGKQAPTNKPKGKRRKKTIEEQVKETEHRLQALRVKQQIEDCDHPREAKALLRATKILRDLDEEDAADAVMDVVREMCGIEEEDGDE